MPEIRALKALAGASLAFLVGCGVSACSKAETPSTSPRATAPTQAAPLVVRLSTITGRLPVAGRDRLRSEVEQVIDAWWRSAYLGAGGADPFARSFTPGAARLARRDAELLSNAGMTGIGSIEARRREADLDILAVKGAARGITAVLHLTYDTTGRSDRRCVVAGNVSLAPTGAGWRIFGYDVTHTCHPRRAGS